MGCQFCKLLRPGDCESGTTLTVRCDDRQHPQISRREDAGKSVCLQLAAHPTDAALIRSAAIDAAATILGIAHEGGDTYASAHAHFKTSRTVAKTAPARFREGALIAAPAAVLGVGDECDRVSAPALAPLLTNRTACGTDSRSVGRRRSRRRVGSTTRQKNDGDGGNSCKALKHDYD
jgi:hypothetical protein